VSIAGRCDGVRCDMAMLVLDDVAERTWAARLQPRRPEPYWIEVTRRVREQAPGLLFLAEAYWDLEQRLLDEGIDGCYDKRLYDRLAHEDAASFREHLTADSAWQEPMVRFLENHDEPRAAVTFPPARNRAAAVALMTLPGRPLLYRGEVEGRRLRLPVHLGREPAEPVDEELARFWRGLLETVSEERVRTRAWGLLPVAAWPGAGTDRWSSSATATRMPTASCGSATTSATGCSGSATSSPARRSSTLRATSPAVSTSASSRGASACSESRGGDHPDRMRQ